MKLAIVSTPRSGNTWVRLVLGEIFGLSVVGVHNYRDITEIPDDCLLQLHWYREPNFQAFLREHGFQVLVIARHPLDVLLLILHFIRYEAQTARWLEGNGEIPAALVGQSPASEAFRAYAAGWGAENLLSVSYQWWRDPDAIKVRYEDLVADPVGGFKALVRALGGPEERVEQALANNGIDALRDLPNRHAWQGRPGLWRELIPGDLVQTLQARHARLFEVFGYDVEPGDLTAEQAEANWAAFKR